MQIGAMVVAAMHIRLNDSLGSATSKITALLPLPVQDWSPVSPFDRVNPAQLVHDANPLHSAQG